MLKSPIGLRESKLYPHGSVMPGRNYVGASAYRYGYQGQFAEKDPETNKDNFELRQWDGLLGKWSSTDPYGQYHSPYLGMSNNPVNFIDPNGGFDTKLGAWLYSAFNGGEVGYATDKGEWYVGGQFELTKDFGVGYQRTFEFQSSIFNSFNNVSYSGAQSFGGDYLQYEAHFVNAYKTQGNLIWYNSSGEGVATYPAVSGASNIKSYTIPEGNWNTGYLNSQAHAKYSLNDVSFRVTLGPDRYDPLRGRETGLIRIHPARSPGTEGCIGLRGDRANLLDFYNRYSNHYNKYGRMPVYVIYPKP